ncbi:hypothetical protein G6F49_005088 [Rhizopus delemar]|nr:hypothetical protein G6F49_005088 [Rhizopus delemar]
MRTGFKIVFISSSPSSNSSFLSTSIGKSESTSPQSASYVQNAPTIQSPPSGGSNQIIRHPSNHNGRSQRQSSSASLDRSMSQCTQRPTSPVTSPSIHKSLNALDAKLIARDVERSTMHLRGEDIISPSSPSGSNFYFSPSNAASNNTVVGGSVSFQSMAAPTTTSTQYHRQNSFSNMSSITSTMYLNNANNNSSNSGVFTSSQEDAWQTLCVRVLPLFNGEGVKGSIEDLNELLRRCLSDPMSPQFYHDIEALLRDGMFTLNSKMFGVTDEKLLDRLVEQWSFFFSYALPYFEAVFLPLQTDIIYRSADEAEAWNVRNMAMRSFRDNVILLQTKRLEDVFNKLFTDFGSSQNPAATAAKMLQMTSLLASSPDHNEEIERVLNNLKANWKIMMRKGDRRGFAGVRKVLPAESSNHIFGTLQQ